MPYKIKITERLGNDIFAQYKGKFLSENTNIVYSKENGRTGNLKTISTGDNIMINIEQIGNQLKQNELILGSKIEFEKEINVNAILSLYDGNPDRIPVLTVTKIL